MIRDITIYPVLNGFVVHAGCQRIVFTTANDMLANLEKYYNAPDEVEKHFLEKSVNAKHTMHRIPETQLRPDCGLVNPVLAAGVHYP